MAVSEIRRAQTRTVNLLLINVLIAVIAPLFITIFGGMLDYLLAFAVGFIVLAVIDRRYAVAILWTIIFFLYLLWEILLSNISLAWLVIQPKPDLDPGIIAVPLRVRTGLEITMLASAITLTPGTLTVELQRGEQGEPILYVHSLRIKNPEQMRASIRDGFEAMILRISSGVST